MQDIKDKLLISTDKRLLDRKLILDFLQNESYWAQNRTEAQMERAIKNSICFGVYLEGRQIAFARVVTDMATFAYLGDVFVVDEFRGKGVSKLLMSDIISYEGLQGLRRWILATKDAHTLYEKFGFSNLKFAERWMERPAPDAY